jgi:hypothetical protein
MTQNEAILGRLKEGKSVTQMGALQAYGCFRLAARINELRKQGHLIKTLLVKAPNGRSYARYRL